MKIKKYAVIFYWIEYNRNGKPDIVIWEQYATNKYMFRHFKEIRKCNFSYTSEFDISKLIGGNGHKKAHDELKLCSVNFADTLDEAMEIANLELL